VDSQSYERHFGGYSVGLPPYDRKGRLDTDRGQGCLRDEKTADHGHDERQEKDYIDHKIEARLVEETCEKFRRDTHYPFPVQKKMDDIVAAKARESHSWNRDPGGMWHHRQHEG
jgi:hypothetical protein